MGRRGQGKAHLAGTANAVLNHLLFSSFRGTILFVDFNLFIFIDEFIVFNSS